VTDRPVPVPDETSAPFWAATAEGALALARCAACDAVTHPPAPVCPTCGSTEPAWSFRPVPGEGLVRSWTVLHRPFLPGFVDDLPIVLVDVEIQGTDVRLIGRLLDGPDVELSLGAAVRLDFEHLDGGVAVPAFWLAGGG
jgi:uncharacterized protein